MFPRIKLPKVPLSRVPVPRLGRLPLRKVLLTGLLGGAVVGAFFWGRHGARTEARAQAPVPSLAAPAVPKGNPGVVACIYGSVPITREELGEYLIERFGAERVEFLVNRRIIELACRQRGIEITNAEIEAQLQEDLRSFNVSRQDFVNNILKRYNKSLLEWREDVIRPKLALGRFVRDRISIGEDEIRKGFEAKFGEKVECRLIIIPKEQAHNKYKMWDEASKSEADFDRLARLSPVRELAAEGGKIPPINKHYGDPRIEQAAFALQPGQVSPLIEMEDHSLLILRCVKRIPADTDRRLDTERMMLLKELTEVRLAQEMPAVFMELHKAAAPQIFLQRATPPQDAGQGLQLMARPSGLADKDAMPAMPQR